MTWIAAPSLIGRCTNRHEQPSQNRRAHGSNTPRTSFARSKRSPPIAPRNHDVEWNRRIWRGPRIERADADRSRDLFLGRARQTARCPPACAWMCLARDRSRPSTRGHRYRVTRMVASCPRGASTSRLGAFRHDFAWCVNAVQDATATGEGAAHALTDTRSRDAWRNREFLCRLTCVRDVVGHPLLGPTARDVALRVLAVRLGSCR